jgi:hypothetical protein
MQLPARNRFPDAANGCHDNRQLGLLCHHVFPSIVMKLMQYTSSASLTSSSSPSDHAIGLNFAQFHLNMESFSIVRGLCLHCNTTACRTSPHQLDDAGTTREMKIVICDIRLQVVRPDDKPHTTRLSSCHTHVTLRHTYRRLVLQACSDLPSDTGCRGRRPSPAPLLPSDRRFHPHRMIR